MAKRTRIILTYSYNENWIGGTYYIQNLIFALNRIEDKLKPLLLIVTHKQEDFQSLKVLTGYPYIESIELNLKQSLFVRILNKISREVSNKDLFGKKHPKFDLFFQTLPFIELNRNSKVLYWIPDFQEKYYPAFFKEDELDFRKDFQFALLKKGKNILLSSENAKNDFNKFYPGNNLKQFVLPFGTSLPALNNDQSDEELLLKYNLPSEYFICCNQFWIHKNHKIVLKAVYELKKNNISVTVAFTGKEHDHRSPDYSDSIKKLCKELNLEQNVRFLGFINRNDQLKLMKSAIAVIQPSLFEGWSTVVEDAKALNSNIIASNIHVHQEQLINYSSKLLFDPCDEKSLATCMANKTIDKAYFNYDDTILKFGNRFYDIVSKITK